MNPQLETLLELRRTAEQAGRFTFATASAARAQAEAELARLRRRWRSARTARVGEPGRLERVPTTAGKAVTRERYRLRLATDEGEAAARVAAYRQGPLAAAIAAEAKARAAYAVARRELEAVERLMARAAAGESRRARRRAEDAAGDIASAAYVRRQRR